jgi:hypothetical protein
MIENNTTTTVPDQSTQKFCIKIQIVR